MPSMIAPILLLLVCMTNVRTTLAEAIQLCDQREGGTCSGHLLTESTVKTKEEALAHFKEQFNSEVNEWFTIPAASNSKCGAAKITLFSNLNFFDACKPVCSAWIAKAVGLCPSLELLLGHKPAPGKEQATEEELEASKHNAENPEPEPEAVQPEPNEVPAAIEPQPEEQAPDEKKCVEICDGDGCTKELRPLRATCELLRECGNNCDGCSDDHQKFEKCEKMKTDHGQKMEEMLASLAVSKVALPKEDSSDEDDEANKKHGALVPMEEHGEGTHHGVDHEHHPHTQHGENETETEPGPLEHARA